MRERDIDREREREREKKIEGDRERQTEKERQRESERHRERARGLEWRQRLRAALQNAVEDNSDQNRQSTRLFRFAKDRFIGGMAGSNVDRV